MNTDIDTGNLFWPLPTRNFLGTQLLYTALLVFVYSTEDGGLKTSM